MNFQHRFAPHLGLIAVLALILIVSILTNRPALVGYPAAALTDPLILLAGILAGALIVDIKHLAVALVVLSVVLSLVIAQMNADWLGEFKFSAILVYARLTALSVAGFLANAIRLGFTEGAKENRG